MRLIDHGAHDVDMLVVIEGRRFAGGADGHQPIDAALKLVGDEFLQIGIVDPALAKGRDKCGEGAGKRAVFHEDGHCCLAEHIPAK